MFGRNLNSKGYGRMCAHCTVRTGECVRTGEYSLSRENFYCPENCRRNLTGEYVARENTTRR